MDKVQIAKEIIAKAVGEKPVYSVEDAQKLFNKSRQEIYNLIYEGILKPIERNNKPRRYTFTFISLLNAYIKLTEGE
ncbi:MAG: helix-turn-helix domain-containing protein [Aquificae bacterium]|nr:helix-turn-helix domain-containing protein [Aquificota bacterium]